MTVTLRPELPSDELFLRNLILDTIAAELGASAWPEPLRTQLLGMQYAGRRHVGNSAGFIVEADGVSAGWEALASTDSEVRLVEIMVLAELRGQGIGAVVIRQIQASARESGKPVRLNVNVTNAGAIRLYERLGFRQIESNQVQHTMEFL